MLKSLSQVQKRTVHHSWNVMSAQALSFILCTCRGIENAGQQKRIMARKDKLRFEFPQLKSKLQDTLQKGPDCYGLGQAMSLSDMVCKTTCELESLTGFLRNLLR